MCKRRTSVECWLAGLLSVMTTAGSVSAQVQIDEKHAIIIAEAFHLQQTLGEKIWPGWSAASMPLVFITEKNEFMIGLETTLEGFARLSQRVADRIVQVRPRQLETTLAASFDYQGVPAVVVGTPENLECSPSMWALTVAHEMFHVLSIQRGGVEKTRSLRIGAADDAAWQLEFPYPYDDLNVMRLMHLQGYPIFLAITAPEDDSSVTYNAGTALEALGVLSDLLLKSTGDDRASKYALFQEGEEGVARYTEYRLAELAASETYVPLGTFQSLDDFVPYSQIWDESYQSSLFVIKHAGRAVKTRTLFYYLGLGKALLLDRIKPDWKDSYFAPDVWLDDLLKEAVGAKTTLSPLEPGTPAPRFTLHSLDGASYSLESWRGKVVLLDFWQWWCPPCVGAMPYLQALHEKNAARGLVILGISDRVDESAHLKMQELMRENGASFPAIIDPTGDVLRSYGVNGYPTLVLIDRAGKVRYTKTGFTHGDEQTIAQRIEALLIVD